MKRKQIFGMGLAMAVLAVSGCQKSPEKSIVINKDFNKMVEQAQAEDQGVSEVAELLAQNPESDYYIWQNSMTEISSIFDGVLVDNEDSCKLTEEWQGDEYVKKTWQGESIVVFVNDRGIVDFEYLSPIELVETVVEKAQMKPFEEIKDIFKQMIIVTNADHQRH